MCRSVANDSCEINLVLANPLLIGGTWLLDYGGMENTETLGATPGPQRETNLTLRGSLRLRSIAVRAAGQLQPQKRQGAKTREESC